MRATRTMIRLVAPTLNRSDQWAQEQIVSPSSRRSNWSPQRAQVGGSSLARTKRARIMVTQKARYGTTRAGEFMVRLIGRSGLLV